DAGDMGAGDDGQVGPYAHMRMQIGGGGRTALSPARVVPELGDLIEPGALLLRAVEIVVGPNLHLRAGFEEGAGDAARLRLIAHLQWSAGPVKRVLAALVAF